LRFSGDLPSGVFLLLEAAKAFLVETLFLPPPGPTRYRNISPPSLTFRDVSRRISLGLLRLAFFLEDSRRRPQTLIRRRQSRGKDSSSQTLESRFPSCEKRLPKREDLPLEARLWQDLRGLGDLNADSLKAS